MPVELFIRCNMIYVVLFVNSDYEYTTCWSKFYLDQEAALDAMVKAEALGCQAHVESVEAPTSLEGWVALFNGTVVYSDVP
jgi:hypothetical protein